MGNLCTKVAGLLLCAVALAGYTFADTIPNHDPIIDTEPGTGSTDFNGFFQFTIFDSPANCTGFENVRSCDGNTGVLRNLGATIFNLDFLIHTFNAQGEQVDLLQGVFSAPPNSPFQLQEQKPSDIEAIYADPEGTICRSNPERTCEFYTNFSQVLIPTGGRADISITANVPEPASAVLLLSVLPGLWVTRRRLRRS